jgi:hypothetical protein
MIQFNPLKDTHIQYKGKYVRFRGNKKTVKSINDKAEKFELISGATGYCYQVNGAAMYIAFKKKMSEVPGKSSMFAMWEYHLVIYPHTDKNWEVEA